MIGLPIGSYPLGYEKVGRVSGSYPSGLKPRAGRSYTREFLRYAVMS